MTPAGWWGWCPLNQPHAFRVPRPMGDLHMTLQQALSFGLVGLTVVVFIWGRWRYDLVALAAIMVSFSLCMTAFGFAIGTFIRSEMQGAAMLNLLGLTLAPLGGAWWPLSIVPEFMRVIGHLSPIAWAMDGFHLLLYEQGTLADVLLPVGILLALAAVFFAIAIARFKYE